MSTDLERARQLFAAGLEQHIERQWIAAEDLYRHALKLMPDRPSIVFNLGRLMLDQEKYPQAETLFQHALRLAPDHETSYNLALVLSRQDRPAEALPHYEQAIALKPDFAAAHAGRGWALEHLGRGQQALESHARSVELAPEQAEYQSAFCRCAASVDAAADLPVAASVEAAVLICLMASHVELQNLHAVCVAILERRFGTFRGFLAAAQFDWMKITAARLPELHAFCGDWLQVAVLEKIILTDPASLQFYARLRAGILKLTVVGPKNAGLSKLLEPLALFLAQQCHLGRYTWPVGEGEAELTDKLLSRVSAAIAAGAVGGIEIGTLCCYMPLSRVPGAGQWSSVNVGSAEPALKRLLMLQVEPPLRHGQAG